MKKAIIALLMVLCAVTLFAASWSQTIHLVSVVESVEPNFYLGIKHVENGYAESVSNTEVSIFSHNVRENVVASFEIGQMFSRYMGQIEVAISVSELCWNGYHTENLQISGKVNEIKGRTGYSVVSGNNITFNLDYSGKYVEDSVAAEFSVVYNGNANLPNETYVSYVRMAIEVK